MIAAPLVSVKDNDQLPVVSCQSSVASRQLPVVSDRPLVRTHDRLWQLGTGNWQLPLVLLSEGALLPFQRFLVRTVLHFAKRDRSVVFNNGIASKLLKIEDPA